MFWVQGTSISPGFLEKGELSTSRSLSCEMPVAVALLPLVPNPFQETSKPLFEKAEQIKAQQKGFLSSYGRPLVLIWVSIFYFRSDEFRSNEKSLHVRGGQVCSVTMVIK